MLASPACKIHASATLPSASTALGPDDTEAPSAPLCPAHHDQEEEPELPSICFEANDPAGANTAAAISSVRQLQTGGAGRAISAACEIDSVPAVGRACS